jgi:hypothetical protein
MLVGLALMIVLAAGGGLYLYSTLLKSEPPEQVLTSRNGEVMRVRIEGRSPDAVKVLMLSDGQMRFLPIADLSAPDQALVNQLPAGLTIQYPFMSTLTNQQTHTLPVMILGRTADAVDFIRLSDHKIYTYAIAKLSATDQDFVRSLPLDAPVSVTAALPALPSTTAADGKASLLVAQLQDLIANLILGPPSPGAIPVASSAAPGGTTLTETTPSETSPSIFAPLPGIDAPAPAARAPTGPRPGTAQAELAHAQQVYQQIANVTTNLAQSLANTNPADDAAVEQQLLAAQNQLLQIAQQNGAAGNTTAGAGGG